MRCLTQAQQKGAMMRARGINYRGGYTRDELREKRENEQKDRDENEKDYYKHNMFVNRRNRRVVSVVDVFKINYVTFIQYRNPYGDSRRKTTLSKDKFHKLYRNLNENK